MPTNSIAGETFIPTFAVLTKLIFRYVFQPLFSSHASRRNVSCHADVAETDFQLSLRLLFWILGSDGQLSAIAEKKMRLDDNISAFD